MPKPKINVVVLNQLLRSGKSQKDIAKYFNVTEGAISLAKKRLNITVVKSIVLENAHRVVNKNLDTVDQLKKINDNANEILDLLMRWNRGDVKAFQILESQVATKKNRIDPRELAIKAMAEIRGQLKLQLEIFQTLYDMQAVEQFQQEVLTVIGEVDPDVRRRIIDQLAKKRAIRSAIKFD